MLDCFFKKGKSQFFPPSGRGRVHIKKKKSRGRVTNNFD